MNGARALPPASRRPRQVRVLLVSDVRAYREALARIRPFRVGLRIVAAVGHHDGALALAREHRPDVVLIDMRTPESFDLARALAAQVPAVRVVGFGLAETEENVLAYARAGIAGYVLREASIEDIVTAVRGIARGEVRYSRRISAMLLQRLANGAGPYAGAVQLTPRETEIVRLIDEGLSNREIASRLKIGLPTVKNHVHNLLEKLQVHRRGEAVARLRRQPLPSPNPTV